MGEGSESTVTIDRPEPPQTEATPELNPEPTEESPVDTPKKKKKKKKDKVKEEETEEEVTPSCQLDSNTTPELNGAMSEANGNEAGEKKKKKKKKKEKHLKEEEEEEEVEVSPMEVHGSDSSGYLSDKPSKKRKHVTGTDGTSSFSEDPEPPKSKKKRKSGIEQFA